MGYPHKVTFKVKHANHNSLSNHIVRTPSAQIHFPNSTGVFGHRAILIWGIEAWLGGHSDKYRSNVGVKCFEYLREKPIRASALMRVKAV